MEQWKAIPVYEGIYEISDLGNARSLRKYCVHYMRPYKSRGGYFMVCLRKNQSQTNNYIHLLVLLAFIGPRLDGMQTRHLNGNRADNRLCNLKYGTCSENREDMVKHGTIPHGEKSYNAKLKEIDVMFIRDNIFNYSDEYLGKIYGVTSGAIRSARTHQSWKSIGNQLNL